MARSVSDAFHVFLDWLAPNSREIAARTSHSRSIAQGLEAAFRNFKGLTVIGSHTRGTAIYSHSDVDYLALLSRDDVRWGDSYVSSTTALKWVKEALEIRFKSTPVRISGPAVVVEFAQGAVDVVPGFYAGKTPIDGYPMYHIADGVGSWLRTSPTRHSKYLKEHNARTGHKFSRVIQLLKAWKYARATAVPVLGFHLEMMLASEGVGIGVASYGGILAQAFKLIRDRQGRALNDPLGISSRIPAAATSAQAEALTKAASAAYGASLLALNAELDRDIDEAFKWWDRIFNGAFPSRR